MQEVGLVIVPGPSVVYWTSSQREGGHPAVIAFGEDGVVTWGGEALAEKALSLARGLRVHGIDNGNL